MTARMIKLVALILRLLQLPMAAYIVGVASYHTWEFATNRLSLTDGSSGHPPKALYAILVIVSSFLSPRPYEQGLTGTNSPA